MSKCSLIAIGASAGGVTAILRLLNFLPKDFKLPILVIQHLPADAHLDHELIFGRSAPGRVCEALDKMAVESGCVYFAPAGYHLLVERNLTFSLSQDEPVHFARPSIDVTFESLATGLGPATCGVLLTGANSDGASGLYEISLKGGYTFVQDPDEAESKQMPSSAIGLFTPTFVGTIEQIAQKLSELNKGVFL